MSVLFGHPTGTPFSHHAALAHFEAGWLESFCVPWMPSAATLRALQSIGPLRGQARRLARRRFEPLAAAPKTQGRLGEIRRLALRALGGSGDSLADEANDWLMRTLARESRRREVTAIHAYEDCSLLAFAEARRLGKACIYEMPIGYYPAWERIRDELEGRYADWAPAVARLPMTARRARKLEEMDIADLVLAPSRFVADTVREFHPDKPVAIAPYGVDLAAWPALDRGVPGATLTFLFAGQCSIRKGVPLLLEAWRAAGLKDARLRLVGPWQLSEEKKRELPPGASWTGPVSSPELRGFYRDADVFAFPTNFEGRALVVLEALASGLPVLTTAASGADDAVAPAGRLTPPEDLDALVDALRWFDAHRDALPAMSRAARAQAEASSWDSYRPAVVTAVRPYV